jgi:hypothetical protein
MARLHVWIIASHATAPGTRVREAYTAGSDQQDISFVVEHAEAGRWLFNGDVVPNLDGCVDLDFGFTPATNLLQLRRIALAVGEAANVPVAWLDVTVPTLSRLDQRYHRQSQTAYEYEAAIRLHLGTASKQSV